MLFEKRRRRRESHNAGKRYDCQIRILVYIYCAKKNNFVWIVIGSILIFQCQNFLILFIYSNIKLNVVAGIILTKKFKSSQLYCRTYMLILPINLIKA